MDGGVDISVIMPVYAVEEYVRRAVCSILGQSHKNLELIAVDDGSPDNCAAILDELAAGDGRMRVIHQKNAGAPAARNLALSRAVGKYVYFMDPDDWAEEHMLAAMLRLAQGHNAQAVVAGFYIDTYYSPGQYVTQELFFGDRLYQTAEDFRREAYALFDRNLLYSPWNKLFLKSYLLENDITFPQTFWDDFPFNLSAFRRIERVVVTSARYYHFIRQRPQSETAIYRDNMYQKREEEHAWMKELYQYWGLLEHAQSREMIARRHAERVIGCIENVASPQCALPRGEKTARIRAMITHPELRQSLRLAKPRSAMMRAMLLPLRLRAPLLCYAMGRYIARVKGADMRRFATLKARR